MRSDWIAWGVGFALLCATPSPGTAADGDGQPVRVLSYNIRYGTAQDGENHWDHRRDALVAAIRACDPDLLGTQESLGFQRDFLAKNLPDYAVLGVGRDDGKEAGEMMALYYKTSRFERLDGGHFWYSETPEVAGSRGWDAALPRMVTWVKLRDRKAPSAPPILFANTHFDHRGAEARLQSARLLRSRLSELGSGCSIVLTGDFNSGEDSAPYRALFGESAGSPASPVKDAYRVAHPTPGAEEGTFSGFSATRAKGARIDWIGASADWTVVSATIDRTSRDGRTPSDHFAVIAELSR